MHTVSCEAPDVSRHLTPKAVDKPVDPHCNQKNKVHLCILTGEQQLYWSPLSKCHGNSCSDPALLLPSRLIFNIVLLAEQLVIV